MKRNIIFSTNSYTSWVNQLIRHHVLMIKSHFGSGLDTWWPTPLIDEVRSFKNTITLNFDSLRFDYIRIWPTFHSPIFIAWKLLTHRKREKIGMVKNTLVQSNNVALKALRQRGICSFQWGKMAFSTNPISCGFIKPHM